jgi:hypothetical protein
MAVYFILAFIFLLAAFHAFEEEHSQAADLIGERVFLNLK